MMATMVPIVVGGGGEHQQSTETETTAAYVFFDPGSFLSFIRKGFAQQIRAKKVGASQLLKANAFGAGHSQLSYTQRVSVQLRLEDGGYHRLELQTTDRILEEIASATAPCGPDGYYSPAGITIQSGEPDILIGVTDFWRYFHNVTEIAPQLFLVQTSLGDMVSGNLAGPFQS